MVHEIQTVLLVGPAQDDRSMYAEYLRLRGVQPIEADDAAAALAVAARADAIVTGIHLAGNLDGLELIRCLRAADVTRGKPIIVLTASVLGGSRLRANAAGCDGFLTKPCYPDTLWAELLRVTSLRTAPPQIPAPSMRTQRIA
jgi:two-component system, cell cycle response regulator DivK